MSNVESDPRRFKIEMSNVQMRPSLPNIKNIYADGELLSVSTYKKFLLVRTEGKMRIMVNPFKPYALFAGSTCGVGRTGERKSSYFPNGQSLKNLRLRFYLHSLRSFANIRNVTNRYERIRKSMKKYENVG